MSFNRKAVLVLGVAGLLSCNSNEDLTGYLGQACFADGTCRNGMRLTCVQGTCKQASTITDTGILPDTWRPDRYLDPEEDRGIAHEGIKADSKKADAGEIKPDILDQHQDKGPIVKADGKVPLPCDSFECLVKAGTFTMSQSSKCAEVFETPHSVTLTYSFYVQRYETTQAEFQALMGYNPSVFNTCSQCPVENVTWAEAMDYCNKLSQQHGFNKCHTCTGTGSSTSCTMPGSLSGCNGYRLPTEAEWEYAYRGGTTTDLYNGNLVDCTYDTTAAYIAWYAGSSMQQMHPVGGKLMNPYGLYDMAGNAAEYVLDKFNNVAGGGQPEVDPLFAVGSSRCIKGGTYNLYTRHIRAAYRSGVGLAVGDKYTGFRCVRSQ